VERTSRHGSRLSRNSSRPIPHYEIGVAAADLLLERIAGREDGPTEVVLPAHLIVRGSTRRA
jgi:DNA-binding LacI/PurR family transcriptional regulator